MEFDEALRKLLGDNRAEFERKLQERLGNRTPRSSRKGK